MNKLYKNALRIACLFLVFPLLGLSFLPVAKPSFLIGGASEVTSSFTPQEEDRVPAQTLESGNGHEMVDAINLGESTEYPSRMDILGSADKVLEQKVADRAENYRSFFAADSDIDLAETGSALEFDHHMADDTGRNPIQSLFDDF